MNPDTVLLPICVAIALIGVVLTGLAWRRGNKGRVLQGAALAVVPFGLYLTGLLSLLWDGVVAVTQWAVRLVFSPTVWIGTSIIGFSVVLFVVGALLRKAAGDTKPVKSKSKKAVTQDKSGGKNPGSKGSGSTGSGRSGGAEVDPEMAEIEALLKSRGIE